ncbi:hypothetical protein DL95DRAFT_417104 [Leptodontidium sp. 2 PMI_412]|nr:hypothetical protein BKA61DRAFT_582618 [Leptodontidium sp. MPI-SDFR-AT-0119]KAH9205794.1 hypothetical protein DL95DRAFT_417104 [Leptodontidium sp. 2 PMI_412]
MKILSIPVVVLWASIATQSVLANNHASCFCSNGDSANTRIASPACQYYAKQGYSNSDVSWNSGTGRCVANSGSYLMGDQWEAACRSIASSGFNCLDGRGKCYASTGQVRGRC